jgi:integrase
MLELQSDPYSMFIFAMNAPQTREKYTTRLKRFFDFIDLPADGNNNNVSTIIPIDERCKHFVEKAKNDQKWLLNNVLKFLLVQKERVERKEITGATVRNYVKTIKLFCEMSDLLLPWKKITRGLPKGRKYADDRAPTIEEIRRIIEYPDRRIKAIVYTMTSSGIRVGAWDFLKWKRTHNKREFVSIQSK